MYYCNFLVSLSFLVICFQIVFFGIDNIHAMRDSLSRLRDYLDTYGATSSDGMSSFLVMFNPYKDQIGLPMMNCIYLIYLGKETVV